MAGPPGGDLHGAGYVPPDRPYALDDDHATTYGGVDQGDTLDDRLHRERPDVDLDTPLSDAEGDRAGRLEASTDAPDTWNVASLDAVNMGVSGGAATAEEAAVHVLPAEEMGEAPDVLAADLDDDDLLDDDRAPQNLEQRPEDDVRVGLTSTGDDLSAEANIPQGPLLPTIDVAHLAARSPRPGGAKVRPAATLPGSSSPVPAPAQLLGR